MQAAAEQVVRGRMDVAEATRRLDRRVNAILEKRRWMLALEAVLADMRAPIQTGVAMNAAQSAAVSN